MSIEPLIGVKAMTIRTPWRTYLDARNLLTDCAMRAAVVNVAWRDTAARLIDDGIAVWLFALPEQNDEGTGDDAIRDEWQDTVARMSETGKAIGAKGQVLNGERGFGILTNTERASLVGNLTRRARSGESITFATHNGLAKLARRIGPELGRSGVFCSPEAYHYQRADGDIVGRVSSVVAGWRAFGFAGVTPYVGSLAKGTEFHEARAVRYWDAAEAELGGLVWCSRRPRGIELAAMRRWALRQTGRA